MHYLYEEGEKGFGLWIGTFIAFQLTLSLDA